MSKYKNIKQPETFEEALDYLRTLGDVKAGFKEMAKKTKEVGCAPCQLCDVDPYKVAEVIMQYVLDEKIRARNRERERLKRK